MPRTRPAVFVGSSSESYSTAEAVQILLDRNCEVELWNQGAFGLTQGNLESLVDAINRFDFAILVLGADDLTISRGSEQMSARDNVIFELGLFMGGLGRDRTFFIYDRTNSPTLPSDLAGVTAATYAPHSSGNLEAALGAACAKIQNQIGRLGIRDLERARALSDATERVQVASTRMNEMVRLLARSRKVELEIISSQFGPMIDKNKLRDMMNDLRDLEEIIKG